MTGHDDRRSGQSAGLPTPDEILARAAAELDAAYRALTSAADWLRSDWRPLGSALTTGQARRRAAMREAIRAAKGAIERGRL